MKIYDAKQKKIHSFRCLFGGLPHARQRQGQSLHGGGGFSDTNNQKVQQLLSGYVDRVLEFTRDGCRTASSNVDSKRCFRWFTLMLIFTKRPLRVASFFIPACQRGAYFVFDDYGFPACRGEKEAVDEFFSDQGRKTNMLNNWTGDCNQVVRPVGDRMERFEHVIIGAGPTGLGAAWRLHELGHSNWVMIEASTEPGGLSSSFLDDQGIHLGHRGSCTILPL